MNVTRTFDILEWYQNNFTKDDALAGKVKGEWIKYSTQQYVEYSNNFSYGLLALGFKKGDKIATVSNNRPEWNFVDMGMAQIGIVHIPIYPTISEEDYMHILKHSEAKSIIISDKLLYYKLKPIIDKIPTIQDLYTFDEINGAKNWFEIVERGKQNFNKYKDVLEKLKNEIKPGDMVSIIYTSGTTGSSKGVMLSHKNIVSNVIATAELQPLNSSHKILSFLPLCHIYERMLNYQYQYLGISIYYAESTDTIVDNMKEIKPDGFTTVPRLLEKVYDKIIVKGKELPFIKKALFFWAVNLGLKYKLNRENGWWYEFKLKIANKLIFSKWRQALGGNVKVIVSGGAALQPRLEKIFWAARIPIVEGYGLTETSPVIASNHYTYPDIRFGTVGLVLNGIEVKIDEDGEILCKGHNVMLGYYKDPEYTKQVIDSEGWLHTGDIGIFEDNKFLKITDRKKEIFKTSYGKYVAPQVIENKFKESLFIEQTMVCGENEKFVSALISPNFPFLHDWCFIKKIKFHNNKQLIQNPDVIARYQKEIYNYNKSLGQTEQIKKFRLVPDEWRVETGELSPTLKLKRKFIAEKYKELVEQIYRES